MNKTLAGQDFQQGRQTFQLWLQKLEGKLQKERAQVSFFP